MKSTTYHYEKGNVHLDFSFEQNDEEVKNKEVFLELLGKAAEELNKELNESYIGK